MAADRPARAMFGAYPLPRADAAAPAVERATTAALSAPVVGQAVRAGNTADLAAVFDRHGYDLEDIKRAGIVPRLFVARMPHDLTAVDRPARRKALFIRIALPLVLAVNEEIMRERARIQRLRAKLAGPGALSIEEERWMGEVFARHGVRTFDFEALLRRVDIVPPSLAIAQSAEESGWGTSRFAREGNALFDQRLYKGARGIVPQERRTGERYRVRRFGRLMDAVRAYVANLNSHPAYARFRSARQTLRREGRRPDGLALAQTLQFYSERRHAYVATIQRIIRLDRLTALDGARLIEIAPLGTSAPRFDSET